jgi:surfeit locus 1 family protein
LKYAAPVIGLLIAVACARLGVWQLDRLEQRRDRNATAELHMEQPPVGADALDAKSLHFRRATLSGVFDFERQVLVVARSYQGVPGVHVVTPLILADGRACLVERGWVPSPDGRTVDLTEYVEGDSARVEGVLLDKETDSRLSAEASWPLPVRSAEPQQLEHRFPYDLVPLVVRRTSTPGNPALRPVPLPPLTNGPHLSYAVQWFTFGTIALVGGVILFFRGTGNGERGTGNGEQYPPPEA